MAIDPADPVQVGEALLEYVAEQRHVSGMVFLEDPIPLGRGMDTRIYSFHLNAEDLGPQWSAPLVLRLFTSADQAGKAQKEADVQAFAVSQGYPAVEPLLIDQRAQPFDLPIMVMPLVAGRPMIDLVASNPLRVPSLLRQMADLQFELHSLSTDGSPLPYDRPLVEAKLDEFRTDQTGDPDQSRALEWLEQHKEAVDGEEPVLCHGDFHPLNILVADDSSATVLDWSDAALGDRHSDVARSSLIFWIAPIIAESTLERVALRLGRGYLQWQYQRAYGSKFALDQDRLRYWKALHTFGGWQLVTRVQDPKGDLAGVTREDSIERLPEELPRQLGQLFWKLAGRS